MRLIVWLFRAFLFFTLFAFALNNLQAVTVRWFFGVWNGTRPGHRGAGGLRGGCVIGVLAMVPQLVAPAPPGPAQRDARIPAAAPAPSVLPSEFGTRSPAARRASEPHTPARAWILTCSGC
jgi:putative membrane protein